MSRIVEPYITSKTNYAPIKFANIESTIVKEDGVRIGVKYKYKFDDGNVYEFIVYDGKKGDKGDGIENISAVRDDENKRTIITIEYGGQSVTTYLNDGASIDRVEETSPSGVPLEHTYTIYYTDGRTSTFNVKDGEQGIQGPRGNKGDKGDRGEAFIGEVIKKNNIALVTQEGGVKDGDLSIDSVGTIDGINTVQIKQFNEDTYPLTKTNLITDSSGVSLVAIIEGKQNVLTAGTAIKIENDVISNTFELPEFVVNTISPDASNFIKDETYSLIDAHQKTANILEQIKSDVSTHIEDEDIHVTTNDKDAWNDKIDKIIEGVENNFVQVTLDGQVKDSGLHLGDVIQTPVINYPTSSDFEFLELMVMAQ